MADIINIAVTPPTTQTTNVTVTLPVQTVINATVNTSAPVLAVNGKVGYVTLTASDIGFSGGAYVTLDGNQTISGTKNFISRPTVNGTGVLLSGEASTATLPNTLVYTTGTQTLGGSYNFTGTLQYNGVAVSTGASATVANAVYTNIANQTISGNLNITGNLSGSGIIYDLSGNSLQWGSGYSLATGLNAVTGNYYPRTNPSGYITGSTTSSNYAYVNANFSAVAGREYLVNTSGNSVTGTLPASPATGDKITFTDSNGTWAQNPIVLNINGKLFEGYSDNLTGDISNYTIKTSFIGGQYGWRLY